MGFAETFLQESPGCTLEIGRPTANLMSAAYEKGAISKLDLAEVLNMKVEQAERFVSWVRENPKGHEGI